MEEEKYLKCSGCSLTIGLFIKDEQDLNIHCGTCDAITLFEVITKEEFEVINYSETKEEE